MSGDAHSYSNEVWQNLLANTSLNAYFIPMMLVELVLRLGLLVVSVLLPILFFRRRTSVPAVYVGLSVLFGVYVALELLAAAYIPEIKSQTTAKDYNTWIRTLVSAVLWSSYFLTSKRVRATFTRRRQGPVAAGALAPAI